MALTNTKLECFDFNEEWLRPGAVVMVDVPTTGALLREVQRLRDVISEGAKWIPVSERLPEIEVAVLAIESTGAPIDRRCIAARYAAHGRDYGWADSTGEKIDVSHWMPLPEGPK